MNAHVFAVFVVGAAEVIADCLDGYVEFILPCDLNDDKIKEINILLDSMYLFLKDIESQYPGNVKITELEV